MKKLRLRKTKNNHHLETHAFMECVSFFNNIMKRTVVLVAFLTIALYLGAQNRPPADVMDAYFKDVWEASDSRTKISYANHEILIMDIRRYKKNVIDFLSKSRWIIDQSIPEYFSACETEYQGYTITVEDVINSLQKFSVRFIDKKTGQEALFHYTQKELKDILFPNAADVDTVKKSKREILEAELEAYKREHCPTTVEGLNVSLTKVCIENDMVTYQYHFPQEQWGFNDTNDMKAAICRKIEYNNGFFYRCRTADLGLQYIYEVEGLEKPVVIAFSPEKFKEVVYNREFKTKSEAESAVNATIQNLNEQVRIELDAYTYLDSVTTAGDDVVFHMTVVNFDKKLYKKFRKNIYFSVSQQLGTTESNSYFLEAMYRAGKNLVYIYDVKGFPKYELRYDNAELEGYGTPIETSESE